MSIFFFDGLEMVVNFAPILLPCILVCLCECFVMTAGFLGASCLVEMVQMVL